MGAGPSKVEAYFHWCFPLEIPIKGKSPEYTQEYIKYRAERTRIRNKSTERIEEAIKGFKNTINPAVDSVIGDERDPLVENPDDPVDGEMVTKTPPKMKNVKYVSYDPLRDRLYPKKTENLNANLDDKSFGGRKGAIDSYVLKKFAFDEILSEKSSFEK